MSEDLLYVLEENNRMDIAKIFNIESICEYVEDKYTELHIMRMEESGCFGVFLNKKEGYFNEKELSVIKSYLSYLGRDIDIEGKERIGIVLDKNNDIKPFNNMDLLFPYNKTYKTQAYARMVGLSIMNEVKDFNNAKPNTEEMYYTNIY